jgi:predicted ester cyclase
MPTARNVEIARTMFAAVTGPEDLAALSALLTDDYVLHDPTEPENCTREGFIEQARKIRERYRDGAFIIHDIFAADDRVAVRWTLAGGLEVESAAGEKVLRRIAHEGISILRIEGDKVAEEWAVYDELGLRRQLEMHHMSLD